jgi:hypothetical protein
LIYHISTGSRAFGFDPRLGRRATALAQLAKLVHVLFGQFRKTLAKIAHRIIEPLGLVLRRGVYDTATHYVLKKFVASLLKWRRGRRRMPLTISILCHVLVVVG